MRDSDELLVLEYPGFAERIDHFYRRLSESAAYRELFLNDPVGVLARQTLPQFHPDERGISIANRLLFSLLRNDRFLQWAREFQAELDEEVTRLGSELRDHPDAAAEAARVAAVRMDRGTLYSRVAQGILDHGDKSVVDALLTQTSPRDVAAAAATQRWKDWVAAETAVVVVVVAVFTFAVTMIDFTPKKPQTSSLTRDDLERLSTFLADRMAARARQQGEAHP